MAHFDPSDYIPILAISGGLFVAIVAIVGNFIAGVARTKAREASRREIAAYIAEGSMTADEGERLLAVGNKDD